MREEYDITSLKPQKNPYAKTNQKDAERSAFCGGKCQVDSDKRKSPKTGRTSHKVYENE